MGRKATFNDPSRQIVQTSEDQHKYDTPTFRRLQVNANVTNQYITPNAKADASALTLAFAEAAPSLALVSQNLARSSGDDAYSEGQAQAIKDMGLPEEDKKTLSWFSHPRFKDGYDSVGGFTTGTEAKTKLETDYEADPNRNNMTTQEWIGQWMRNNQPQNVSGAYIESWNKQVMPSVGAIIKQGATDKAADGLAMVNQKITDSVQAVINSGWNAESAETLKKTIQGDGKDNPGISGMSNADWDRTVLKQVDQYINAGGDPDKAVKVLKWTKENRPDGTPGIYHKPGMAKTIDDMEDKAFSTFIQKNTLAENMDRIGRSGDQKQVVDSILTTALDKGTGSGFKALNAAIKENPELWSPGLRMATMEKLRRIETLNKSGDGDGASTEFNHLRSKALRGEIGVQDIADYLDKGVIKGNQANILKGDINYGDSKDRAVFKTPSYNRAKTLIAALPDDNGVGMDKEYYRQRKAIAMAQLDDETLAGADPLETAKKIHATEAESLKRGVRSDAYDYKYIPRYKTPADFISALQNGKETNDPILRKKEEDYWNWMYPPAPPPTPKKAN